MSLSKCPNCGKDLPNESKFCPYCMENLSDFEAATVPETTSVIKCSHCGKDLPSESSFCPYCMERLSDPVTVTVPAKKKKLSKKTVTIIIVTVVLVALLVGGIALYNHILTVKALEKRKAAFTEYVNDFIESYKSNRKKIDKLSAEVECRTSFDEDYWNCTIYVSNSDGYDFMRIECRTFFDNDITSLKSTLDYKAYGKAFSDYNVDPVNSAYDVILPTYCLLESRNAELSPIGPTRFCELMILATVYDEYALSDEDKAERGDGHISYRTEALAGCDYVQNSLDYNKWIFECECWGNGYYKGDNANNNNDGNKNIEDFVASENNVTENNSNSSSDLNNNSISSDNKTGNNSNNSVNSNSNQGGNSNAGNSSGTSGGAGGSSNSSTNSNSNQGSHSNAGNSSGTSGGTGGNSNNSTNSNSNQGGNSNAGNGSNENDVTVNTNPCDDGHKYIEATCTAPQKCSVCGKISGKALGHDIYVAKCKRCGYSDFSKIAKSYANDDVYACDGKTGEAYDVTNVKISSSGVLSFTFNGKNYAVKLVQTNKQIGTSNLVVFDCYVNGVKEPDATCMYNPDYGFPQFEWENLDGHNLYFYAEEN